MIKKYVEDIIGQITIGQITIGQIPMIGVYSTNTEISLQGLKILITNTCCSPRGYHGYFTVSIPPLLWLGDLLSKHLHKISYVTSSPAFEIERLTSSGAESKQYSCIENWFKTEEEIDKFFNNYKELVVYTINKFIHLDTMETGYSIRCVDITPISKKRNSKLDEILV